MVPHLARCHCKDDCLLATKNQTISRTLNKTLIIQQSNSIIAKKQLMQKI